MEDQTRFINPQTTEQVEGSRWVNPNVTQYELWPGEAGYPWADTGIRLWTREAVLRRVSSDRLMCTWTTGGFSEPTHGNFTMVTYSDNNGASWTRPRVFFQHAHRGLFTTELFVPKPGEIHAFFQTYAFGVWMTQLLSYRSISYDGGYNWQPPHYIPGGIQNVWVNQGIVHSTGRWIIPVSWAEMIGSEWCEPSVGRSPVAPIAGERGVPQHELPWGSDHQLIYRAGVNWANTNHRYVIGVIISDDQGESFYLRGYLWHDNPRHFFEPKIVELSDGSISLLCREWSDGWLWRSRSTDNGETWSPLERSDIPNPSSKVKVLRTADGRIFLIHNPSGTDGKQKGRRNPLSLWVSNDDMRTWSTKVDLVRDPMASLNYPDGFIDEERKELHFAWEDGKRVFIMRVPLDITSDD